MQKHRKQNSNMSNYQRKGKRILILSDLHCGHRFGLAHKSQCVNKYQTQGWKFFEEGLKKYGPFDVVFVNGDAIDGSCKKNSGVELITTNRFEQAEMAIKILQSIPVTKGCPFYFTYGTPYHTGDAEDFELVIANKFKQGEKINIDDTYLIQVEGVLFDLKHKISSASMPHGRSSSPGRDILFAMLKEVKEGRPKANVFIRSHVHYYSFFETMGRIAITTPPLQLNSTYGQRQCSGIIDFGFLTCDVENGKILQWHKHIVDKPLKPEKIVIL